MNVRQLELFVSSVLRIGVWVSGILILSGLILFLATGDASCPYGDLTLNWIIHGDPFFEPSHVIFLGLITLVVTPLLRVAASIISYVAERDWIFATITSFVLTILIIGMILGLG
jgi:uncharacterized membrane protein